MNHRYVVITRPNCVWCDKVKALLDEQDRAYTLFCVTEYPDLVPFLSEQGLKTVPQVYYAGKRVGGYEDLKGWLGHGIY